MRTTWQGYYLDGRQAIRHQVSIQLLPDAIRFTTIDKRDVTWLYERIRQTQGFYSGEQIRLEFGGDFTEALIISDPDFLTALHRTASYMSAHLHNPADRRIRITLTCIAAMTVVVISAGMYLWGIPGLALLVTPHVPVSWEERLGSAVVEHLAPEDKRCEDPDRYRAIQEIVSTLTAATPASPYRLRLFITNDRMINAFAAPGGYIVVYRGLLERTQTPEQLAGVLAHELQHILKRHSTRAIIEQGSTRLLLAAVSGDFSGAPAYGIEGARTLGMLQYSRSHEEEADREGMRMLQAAGVDPAEMITFYRILQEKSPDLSGVLAYLSTHPNTQDRIEALTLLAGHSPVHPVKLIPDLDWRDVRSICRVKATEPQGDSSPNQLD